MNQPKHKSLPQALEFQLPDGEPILWIFDVQADMDKIKDYEFVTIDKPVYSEN